MANDAQFWECLKPYLFAGDYVMSSETADALERLYPPVPIPQSLSDRLDQIFEETRGPEASNE